MGWRLVIIFMSSSSSYFLVTTYCVFHRYYYMKISVLMHWNMKHVWLILFSWSYFMLELSLYCSSSISISYIRRIDVTICHISLLFFLIEFFPFLNIKWIYRIIFYWVLWFLGRLIHMKMHVIPLLCILILL